MLLPLKCTFELILSWRMRLWFKYFNNIILYSVHNLGTCEWNPDIHNKLCYKWFFPVNHHWLFLYTHINVVQCFKVLTDSVWEKSLFKSNFVFFSPNQSHHFNAYLWQRKTGIESILEIKQCGFRPLKDSNFWWFSFWGLRSEVIASPGITCFSSEFFECREASKGRSQLARSTA